MSAQTAPIGDDVPVQIAPATDPEAQRALALLQAAQSAPPDREQEFFDAGLRAWCGQMPAVVFRLRANYAIRTGRPL